MEISTLEDNLSQGRIKRIGSSFATSVAAATSGNATQMQQVKISCLLCEEGHRLELCPKMEKKPHQEKINLKKRMVFVLEDCLIHLGCCVC